MFSRLRSIFGRRNGQHGETRVRKKEAGPRSHWKTWFWGRHRTTEEAPSQLSTFTKQDKQMEKLEELTIKLQSIKNEQIEMSAFLESYTKIDFYNRLKSFEMMKKVHKQVMCDLQRFPLEISDNLNKCKQLIEENNKCYSFLHRIGLPDLTQLKNNVHALKLENEKLLEEQIALQETCEEVKKLLKEVQEKICDPCAEQHKEEESLDERPKNLMKQKQLITQHRDLAEKMEHPFSVLEKMSEPKSEGVLKTMSGNLQCELEPVSAQEESLLQKELLQQEH
ncbi:uncharacterized protein LOC110343802 isoform X1 [Mesocricetus auratus]|uniref:Uncharacterized protein LOC110343802 isoform X1 n=2 Tax=Mesocricetus auratus TaxID=10036 RepID=A0ABM2WQC4_MESAU|nr:uncharacterized protein LOC110343802 isoform X1 [Mesocricetus auratus]